MIENDRNLAGSESPPHCRDMSDAVSDAARARFGVEGAWFHAHPHRVRWSEADMFGHANHAAYLSWFEDARNAYLEALGLTISATTPGPVLAHVEVTYLKPLRHNADILVTARTVSLRTTSFTMAYAAWDGGCAARGSARCVLMINATGARVALPAALRATMVARDGATVETGPVDTAEGDS
jgi:acyl-CoA thioester hydrolase